MELGAMVKKMFIEKQEVHGLLSRLGLKPPLNKISLLCNFNTYKRHKYFALNITNVLKIKT